MAAERNCRWNFAKRIGGVDQGPNDAMGDTFKELPYTALVRESIQNSLDAAKNDVDPVIVTFRLSRVDTMNYPHFFDIRRNIEACIEKYNNSDARKRFKPMLECIDSSLMEGQLNYLEVRDENTKGMSYTANETSSPFYAFVKSIGNSVKENKAKGGSHGFGKAAYFNASKLRTVLISTLTQDGQYVFEGVAGLCTHEIDGQKREHYGFYTDVENKTEEPITLKEKIPARFVRKEVGTSAFIIGVDTTEAGQIKMVKKIQESVIANFWAAIIENKLVVNISIGSTKLIINKDNIFERAVDSFKSQDDNQTYYRNPRPYMDTFFNVGKDFNHIKFEKEKPVLGKLELFLKRTKAGTDSIVCMRSPLMHVKDIRNRTQYGFYGVLVCRDEKGNEILRTMEDATHSKWDYKVCDDKNDRETAKLAEEEIKEFLKECLNEVFRKGDVTTLTFGGLEEFLTIPSSLDDEEDLGGSNESDNGESNGERTDDENAETTTDVEDEGDSKQPAQDSEGTNGQVVIYEGTKPEGSDDGGEDEEGYEPVITDGGGGTSDGTFGGGGTSGGGNGGGGSGGNSGGGNGGEGTSGGVTTGGGSTTGGYSSGDGDPKRRSRLNVRYRAFAQACAGGGYSHRLVINSNRASDCAIIAVQCAGESSNEAIAIKSADQGNWSNNIISNVQLHEGRNVINIWFVDDMRHSITLTVNEE